MMGESGSGIFTFAGRIAEVARAGRAEGYLLVLVPEIASTTVIGGVTYVDMLFARQDLGEPGGWRFEDRADPEADSAQSELESARLDWYGEAFDLRWLDVLDAERVRAEVFVDVGQC